MGKTIITTESTFNLFGKPKRIVEIAVENPWYARELFRKFKDFVLSDEAKDWIKERVSHASDKLIDLFAISNSRCCDNKFTTDIRTENLYDSSLDRHRIALSHRPQFLYQYSFK